MEGRSRLHPNPNGLWPERELYERGSFGPKPERPGLVYIGTLIDPVPVTGLAPNFSPIPRIAPPPFGRDSCGPLIAKSWLEDLPSSGLRFSSGATTPSFHGGCRASGKSFLRATEKRQLVNLTGGAPLLRFVTC